MATGNNRTLQPMDSVSKILDTDGMDFSDVVMNSHNNNANPRQLDMTPELTSFLQSIDNESMHKKSDKQLSSSSTLRNPSKISHVTFQVPSDENEEILEDFPELAELTRMIEMNEKAAAEVAASVSSPPPSRNPVATLRTRQQPPTQPPPNPSSVRTISPPPPQTQPLQQKPQQFQTYKPPPNPSNARATSPTSQPRPTEYSSTGQLARSWNEPEPEPELQPEPEPVYVPRNPVAAMRLKQPPPQLQQYQSPPQQARVPPQQQQPPTYTSPTLRRNAPPADKSRAYASPPKHTQQYPSQQYLPNQQYPSPQQYPPPQNYTSPQPPSRYGNAESLEEPRKQAELFKIQQQQQHLMQQLQNLQAMEQRLVQPVASPPLAARSPASYPASYSSPSSAPSPSPLSIPSEEETAEGEDKLESPSSGYMQLMDSLYPSDPPLPNAQNLVTVTSSKPALLASYPPDSSPTVSRTQSYTLRPSSRDSQRDASSYSVRGKIPAAAPSTHYATVNLSHPTRTSSSSVINESSMSSLFLHISY